MQEMMSYSGANLRRFSFRQLKAVLHAWERMNITHAARALSRSPSAVTKSIKEVEAMLGVKLFERSTSGLAPTRYGRAFARRLDVIQKILSSAADRYREHHPRPKPTRHVGLFSMELSARRMWSLVALADSGDVSVAAQEIAVTPSAIYKLVSELEQHLDLKLFERRANDRLKATPFAQYLTSRIRLVFIQLQHAVEDLEQLNGRIVGAVNLATFPSTRPVVVPGALVRMIEAYPAVKVATHEGPFDEMVASLGDGGLDMVVIGTRPLAKLAGFKVVNLYEDRLRIVARPQHPLINTAPITPRLLREARWVLTPQESPGRRIIDRVLQEMGIGGEVEFIETNSIMIMRSLVLDGGFVAIGSAHQTALECDAGLIAEVPIEVPANSWPIGVLLRTETELSPAARVFLEQMVAFSAHLRASR